MKINSPKDTLRYLNRYILKPLLSPNPLRYLRWKYVDANLADDIHIIGAYKNIELGHRAMIGRFTTVAVSYHEGNEPPRLIIGDNTYIGENNNIRVAGGLIQIGKDCMISQNITMVSSNHETTPGTPMREQGWSTHNNHIIIGNDVWIGANSVILPGVKISDGAVIAAGSIVTKDVEENTIVAGNPASFLRHRT